MARSNISGSRGPAARTDTTHPTTRTGNRGGADRRPYPTASTATPPDSAGARRTPTSRTSPARRTGSASSVRSTGRAGGRVVSTPTPATVWASGRTPIPLDQTWPVTIMTKIVTSFSEPGADVVLLPWPTPASTARTPGDGGVTGGAGDRRRGAPSGEPDPELADVVDAVERLGRVGRVERLTTSTVAGHPASRPFWADLVHEPRPATTAVSAIPLVDSARAVDHATINLGGLRGGAGATANTADLIITSLPPEQSAGAAVDHVALTAAGLLRVGGILAVLTHCDWSQGRLVDPTGPMVAAGQTADLLYLQHIVVLHAPVRDGRFDVESIFRDSTTTGAPGSRSEGHTVAQEQSRAEHRAAVRGLPAPHRRLHSDLLVFAQPHEQPAPLSVADAVLDTGVIR